jgi:hypothetical protein
MPSDLDLVYCVLVLAAIVTGIFLFCGFIVFRNYLRNLVNKNPHQEDLSESSFRHSGFDSTPVADRLKKVRCDYLAELGSKGHSQSCQRRLTALARHALSHFAYFQEKESADLTAHDEADRVGLN